MQDYCVYLLGNNLPLARAEMESLVNLTETSAEIDWERRLGIIRCKNDPISFLMKRAVLLREGGRLLVSSENPSSVLEKMDVMSLSGSDSPEIGFAVKVYDMDSILKSGEKSALAAKIGRKIVSSTDWSVSLNHPSHVFTFFVGKNCSYLCESVSSTLFKSLERTGRGMRSFFHPSMMNAVLARVMCNIAEAMPSRTVLDPFCGGGGILVEAAKIGADIVGLDTNWRLLNGAKKNLRSVSGSEFSLIQGDSRFLPLVDVDCIVTDPPYGRTSSTRGSTTTELVRELALQLSSWENPPEICICADAKMNLASLFTHLGSHIKYRISIPVHASLVREILRVTF